MGAFASCTSWVLRKGVEQALLNSQTVVISVWRLREKFDRDGGLACVRQHLQLQIIYTWKKESADSPASSSRVARCSTRVEKRIWLTEFVKVFLLGCILSS